MQSKVPNARSCAKRNHSVPKGSCCWDIGTFHAFAASNFPNFGFMQCPAFALWASYRSMSKGYCGDPHHVGVLGHWLQTLVIIGFSDFTEYGYHWLGHYFHFMWSIHKHHHVFYNPTPFAVIADEWMDQFMRSLPMVILPAIMPINIDLLFAIFTTLFYGYGVYLHWGHESSYLSAHNPIFNTSYHHYSHHAVSVIGKPVVILHISSATFLLIIVCSSLDFSSKFGTICLVRFRHQSALVTTAVHYVQKRTMAKWLSMTIQFFCHPNFGSRQVWMSLNEIVGNVCDTAAQFDTDAEIT